MNPMPFYRQSQGRSGTMETLDGVNQDRTMGGAAGGAPILMGYQGGGLNMLAGRGQSKQSEMAPLNLLAPRGEGADSSGSANPTGPGSDHAGRLMHELMTKAQTREQAEQMLGAFVAQSGGDAGYEIAGQVAKQLGLRPPWHRDFNEGPAQQPDARMGGSGRPYPLSRPDY